MLKYLLVLLILSWVSPITAQDSAQESDWQVIGRMGGEMIYDLAWSPDGELLAVGGSHRTVIYQTGDFARPPRQIAAHESPMWSLSFTADSRILVGSQGHSWDDRNDSAGLVHLWEAATGDTLATYRNGGVSAAIHGHTLITGAILGANPFLTMIDLRQAGEPGDSFLDLYNEQNGVMKAESHYPISAIALSSDGEWMATTTGFYDVPVGYELSTYSSGIVKSILFWKIDDLLTEAPNITNWWTLDELREKGLVHSVATQTMIRQAVFQPQSHVLATANEDGTIAFWNFQKPEPLILLSGHMGAVWDIVFTPDGDQLISGGWDGTLRFWDMRIPGNLIETRSDYGTALTALALSPDGTQLAIGGWDGRVWVLNLDTGEQQLIQAGHRWQISDIAFSPDGQTLAVGDDNNDIWLWDVATLTEKSVLRGHHGPVTSVVFSPDGTRLASGSLDQTVLVWDIETGDVYLTLREHTAAVEDLAFSPDRRVLASASRDGRVLLWNLERGYVEQSLFNYQSAPVTSVAFSPDGTWLAYGNVMLKNLEDEGELIFIEPFHCYGYLGSHNYGGCAGTPNNLIFEDESLYIQTWQDWDLIDTSGTPRLVDDEALSPFPTLPDERPTNAYYELDTSIFNADHTMIATYKNSVITLWGLPAE